MSITMKPCPFCGESNSTICSTEFIPENRLAHAVSCRTRGCNGAVYSLALGLFETEEEAVSAWNTRYKEKQNP
jgi:Lar family restriction alleviation protein